MPSLQPQLYGQIAGMFRRMARGQGTSIILNRDGIAKLITGSPSYGTSAVVKDPTSIVADVRPLLDGNGIVYPDPVYVINAKARNPLGSDEQRDNEPGLRFVVAGDYTESEAIDGRDWWTTFDEAVAAARSTQVPIRNDDFEVSRACVDLRMSATYAPSGASVGIDTIIARWEVFPDRVVITGTEMILAPHQVEAVMALDPPSVGFS